VRNSSRNLISSGLRFRSIRSSHVLLERIAFSNACQRNRRCPLQNEWPFILQTSVHRKFHRCVPNAKDSFPHMAESLLIQRAPPLTMRFFHHVNNGQGDVAFQRNFQAFHGDVTSLLEKLNAGQCCAHFKSREACRAGRRFASIQQ
jgi:hypothetical protein